jgi:hypothetical protein
MLKPTRSLVTALFLSLTTVWSAMAHHGSQGFDFLVPRKTIKGTVTRFAWQNPHAEIFIDVKDNDGHVATWVMELNNPGNLVAQGWTHSSVKPGDEVTVTFNPGKEDRPIGICVDVVFADGRKLHASQGCRFKDTLNKDGIS